MFKDKEKNAFEKAGKNNNSIFAVSRKTCSS
jgi:hypothetical protein